MVTSITNSLYLSDYQKQQQNRNTGDLDKDAFLRILMTQLQNQDPMSPMEDKEFIAQMAQFTSLEQITNMNTNLQKFIEIQQQNQLLSNSDFIGKEIIWNQEKSGRNGSTTVERLIGTVTAVKFSNGFAELVVNNQFTIDPRKVLQVTMPNNPVND